MRDTAREDNSPGVGRHRRAPALASDPAQANRDVARMCCGTPIEPRLAEIQNRFGEILFVAVWHCPHCGRISY